MLTINLLRDHKEKVLEGLRKKHFTDLQTVEVILELDAERRKLQQQNDELAAQSNTASREIGMLMGQGKRAEAEAIKQSLGNIKEELKKIADQLNHLEQKQFDELVKLPNLPHSSVPEGKHAEDNEVIKTIAEMPQLPDTALPHWELAEKYRLINFELGTKITGSGFPVYTGKGALLQRALINYFLDYNTERGFREHEVPTMVNEDSAFGTGQLPDKEGQMYHVQNEDFFLIPTAEVPLTNLYRTEIIAADQLPVLMTGYTPCFRREAGSYGKDVRGLNRLHQFDKVEIVAITEPRDSYHMLDRMVSHVEELLQSLELPYRILRLCGGDMSFGSALTYDFEVYSAAQKRWLEVSSVSNFETFQTNRMKIRYKDENGKTQLLHSLNGSSLALPRIVACLLENNQKEDGIHLPPVLQAYMKTHIIN